MFCPSCGNKVNDNAKVCDHCGTGINLSKPTGDQGSAAGGQGPASSGTGQTPPPQQSPSEFHFDPVRWLTSSWQMIQADMSNVLIFNLIYVVIASVLCVTVIGILAMPGIMAGYMLAIIGYVRRKEKLDPAKLLQGGWEYYVNVLIYMIVAGILSGLASICLVIPGFVVGMGFLIPAFMLVDKKSDFSTTFNAGTSLISKQIGGLLLFSIILIAMGIVVAIASGIFHFLGGLVAFVLSLFVTPLLWIACFLAYEEIYGEKSAR